MRCAGRDAKTEIPLATRSIPCKAHPFRFREGFVVRISLIAGPVALMLATVSVGTKAAIIDGTFAFSVPSSDYQPSLPGLPDPVTVSFSVDFDTNSFSNPIALSNVITDLVGFYPSAAALNYASGSDVLTIVLASSTNGDLAGFDAANISSLSPTFITANYQVQGGQNHVSRQGSVSFTPAVAAVPEPASSILLRTTLVGFGLMRRRLKIRRRELANPEAAKPAA